MAKEGAIRITCETADTLNITEMTELQGTLKYREDTEYEKIMRSIYKHGIAFPFFVWKSGRTNFILDGHGRTEALKLENEKGITIPPLPVVYVKAKDKETALNLLLRLNSRYGTITSEGMREFMDGVDIDLSNIQIPELPYLAERVDAILLEYQNAEPEFELYCPECGERYDISDEELRRAVRYED